MSILETRISHKYDTTENWNAVQEWFIPLVGELIVYAPNPNAENEEERSVRFKFGDGKTILQNLEFFDTIAKAKVLIEELASRVESVENNYVPKTRTINNKILSEDITLSAENVGAVPEGRKVNGQSLKESDITLFTYGSKDLTEGESELNEGQLYFVYYE